MSLQLTREQFELVCFALTDAKQENSLLGRNLKDWRWHEQNIHGRSCGYLEKRMQLASKQAVLEDVLELDPAQEGPQEVERVTVDFYIVYSSTYRVPVLYFNAFDQAGSPLTLDRIHQTVFHTSRNSYPFAGETFPALTQGEHPTTGGACYFLHPCETETMLGEMLQDREVSERQYIESWLAIVGSLVNIQSAEDEGEGASDM